MKTTQPTPEQQAILDRLSAKPDADIDYSDIPSRNAQWWTGKGSLYKPVKIQKTMRFDADVLAWFMNRGAGYQTRMNSVLRAAMEMEELKSEGEKLKSSMEELKSKVAKKRRPMAAR